MAETEKPQITGVKVDDDPVLSRKEQCRIIRKVDYRLISVTGIIYAISLIGRSNLSAASVAGMTVDLELDVGVRYVRYSSQFSGFHDHG